MIQDTQAEQSRVYTFAVTLCMLVATSTLLFAYTITWVALSAFLYVFYVRVATDETLSAQRSKVGRHLGEVISKEYT